MASFFFGRNPAFIAVLVCIAALSHVNLCDARSLLEIFKLKRGLKLSFYSTEPDDLDIPTHDAYDSIAPPLISFPPIGDEYGSPTYPSPNIAPSPTIGPSNWALGPPAPQPVLAHIYQNGPAWPVAAPNPTIGTSWASGPPTSQPVSAGVFQNGPKYGPPPHEVPQPVAGPSPTTANSYSASSPPASQPVSSHISQNGPKYGPAQPEAPQPTNAIFQNGSRHGPKGLAPGPKGFGPEYGLWCVARPTVPEPMIQRAMDYACGTGADCGPIRPNGPCFQPNTLVAHASYAFNSYWQRTKILGGTCDFGGTAMIVTVDPSFSHCHYVYN